MSARSGSEKRRRSVQVGVRLTAEEAEALTAAAIAKGVSLPGYLRRDEVARAATAREQAIDAMLAVAPCDWWRFVVCAGCNARRGEECQTFDGLARDPHADRRRTGLVLHGTLWLLDRGFVGDVLGEGAR